MITTYRGTVYPYQLDHMGHMNVQWYVAKFDEASWHLFAQLGLTPEFMRREHRGMSAVEQTIHYRAEVLAGDLLVIDSEVLEIRQKVIRFRHRMTRVGTEGDVAQCDIVAVHIDRGTRRSTQFPDFVQEAARSLAQAPDATAAPNASSP